MMDLPDELRRQLARAITRRKFLRQGGVSLGAIALGELLGTTKAARAMNGPPDGDDGAAGRASLDHPLAVRPPMFAPTAKAVIYLDMAGAPPQHDLFDWKPKLVEMNMKPCPDELLKGQQFAFIKGRPLILGSPYQFAQHGESGAWVSELLPNLASVVDDLCIVKSMRTSEFNHAPADLFMHTGDRNPGAAALGAWATYGLGSENQDLPGFVVFVSGGADPTAGKSVWSSGFLPSVYQGVQCRSGKDPVFYVSDPAGMTRATRRATLDALRELNELEHAEAGDPETLTRIAQYELAYRMQVAVPEVMDLSKEPKETLELYGAVPGASSFANHCLLARRMVESGVRFVQLFDWGWDVHGTGAGDDIVTQLPMKCRETDRPVAALLKDEAARSARLDARGLGRRVRYTAMNRRATAASSWAATTTRTASRCSSPAAVGGRRSGATDEFGYHITGAIDVHDLQATLLHLLGFDAHRISYPYNGLNQRLIGPADDPKVRTELLA
jgi:hypothetical protein